MKINVKGGRMIVTTNERRRLKSGWHTGWALLLIKGKYYISQESGTRLATKEEIKAYKNIPKSKEEEC
ncbi:MAG: hypothetical protein DRJ07_03105 [Bacteroidetes bacterium]|nr:MAG: hypothetical protein DRJ07_03105 [Bacteroidota bacterium]